MDYVLALFVLGRLVGRLGQLSAYLLSSALILLVTASDALGLWTGRLALGLGVGLDLLGGLTQPSEGRILMDGSSGGRRVAIARSLAYDPAC